MNRRPLPRRLKAFLETESAAGMLTAAAAFAALIMANSPLGEAYEAFVALPLAVTAGAHGFSAPLFLWVQDGLMTLFFLTVGLELKREMTEGFLQNKDQILLPLFAALAGMIVPSALFALINAGSPETLKGWAIPSATDIAFALAALSIFGRNIPPAAKIFLLAVAVFDDLGAMVIIAAFYNHGVQWDAAAAACFVIAVMALMNRRGVCAVTPYLAAGAALWGCLLHAGVHVTLAGAVTGLMLPMRRDPESSDSPVNRCISALHPWTGFGVTPFFAFVSAGVRLSDITPADMMHPLPVGIAAGLFLGKQAGVFGAAAALIKSRRIAMPAETSWRHLHAISVLAGIGFTMSLFIGLPAFAENPRLQAPVKAGVLIGSGLSCMFGAALLRRRL